MENKKVMIITEQPNSDDRTNEECLFQEIESCMKCKKKGYLISDNKPILLRKNYPVQDKYYRPGNNQFKEVLEEIIRVIKKNNNIDYYWTHYIKCHTKDFPKDEKGIIDRDIKWKNCGKICSESWLKKEIEGFEPDYIIFFGNYSFKALKKLLKIKDSWVSKTITELTKEPKFYEINFNSKKISILPLSHPSGNNTHIKLDMKAITELLESEFKI